MRIKRTGFKNGPNAERQRTQKRKVKKKNYQID